MDKERLVKIFSGNLGEAHMVKNYLELANINSFVKKAPLDASEFEPIGSEYFFVMISELDLDAAKVVMEEYNKQ